MPALTQHVLQESRLVELHACGYSSWDCFASFARFAVLALQLGLAWTVGGEPEEVFVGGCRTHSGPRNGGGTAFTAITYLRLRRS